MHRVPPAVRLPALVALLAAGGCQQADARTIRVSTDAALEKAIADAKAGDVIQLAPGVYAPVTVRNREIDGGMVRLTGKGARISNIQFFRSAGWALDGLEIGGTYDERGRVVRLEHVKRMRITDNLIRGNTLNNDPWDDDVVGIGLRFGEDVEIRNNRFRDLGAGTIIGSSADIHFAGNSLAYIREGLNWVAVKTGTVRCNRFSDFYPKYGKSEHPDAIQLWPNRDGHSVNTLIEGNVMILTGPKAVQGIFVTTADEPPTPPDDQRPQDIVIRDNIYYGSSAHGITLRNSINGLVENNTILSSPYVEVVPVPPRSADGRASSALVPRLHIRGEPSVAAANRNIATNIFLNGQTTGEDNFLARARGNDRPAWKTIFSNPPSGDNPPLESFRVDPGSKAGKAGAGARFPCGAELPAEARPS